jgi:hypothetical protein
MAQKGRLFKKVQTRIRVLNLLAGLKLRKHRILAAAILKQKPDENVRKRLRAHRYKIVDLSRNPYIDSDKP